MGGSTRGSFSGLALIYQTQASVKPTVLIYASSHWRFLRTEAHVLKSPLFRVQIHVFTTQH